jgi:hypothetical protein
MHWLHIYQLNQGSTKFLKVWDPPKVSRCQKGDLKQIFIDNQQILDTTIEIQYPQNTWCLKFVHTYF